MTEPSRVRAVPTPPDSGRAWGAGDDPRELSREMSREHDLFLETGHAGPGVRPLVVRSWERCLSTGLDPELSLAPVDLVDDDLEQWRGSHPLATAMPVIRRLLVDDALESGLLVAISDAAGRLLWVEGSHRLRSAAAGFHFVEGAVWSEERAGTNAPGTALTLNQPVQIFGAEHLSRPVTPWSCSAAPIHDPDTGAVLGALDLTGGDQVAAPHTLSLVRATVAAVEGELRLHRLMHGGLQLPETHDAWAEFSGPLLRTLGRPAAVLQRPGGASRFSLRHSEMLVMLAAHPDGMSGEQLAAALHEHDLAAVTVRAELSRLRPLLGPVGLDSRPYRFAEPLRTDADHVRERIAVGDIGGAVDAYRGPLLPASEAPGVVDLRDRLHSDLRSALLDAGDPDALLRFADTDHGRMDWQVWHGAWSSMAAGSARRDEVGEHLAYLDRELGSRRTTTATFLQRPRH